MSALTKNLLDSDVRRQAARDGHLPAEEEEEEVYRGCPVVSASKLRKLQPDDAEDETIPSLEELMFALDAADAQHALVTGNLSKEIIAVDDLITDSAASSNNLAKAAHLNEDGPAWSFVKTNITGTSLPEASRVMAIEDEFAEAENAALRVPALLPELQREEQSVSLEPQTVKLQIDQRFQGWEIQQDQAEWDDWGQFSEDLTGPRLIAAQLGVGRKKEGKASSAHDSKEWKPPPPRAQQQFFTGSEQMPWEEPMPWEAVSNPLMGLREQLLPQPRPGQDRSQRDSWRIPAPSQQQSGKGKGKQAAGAMESLPGTRGLKKTAALTGKGVSSPLELNPIRVYKCFETFLSKATVSIDDCWPEIELPEGMGRYDHW